MGWSTELFTTISFSRETFISLSDVKEKLEETKEMIDTYEGELRSLALITEPKKFCDKDQDPLWYMYNRVNDILSELNSLYIDRYKLGLLVLEWDNCHDEKGNAITPPDNIKHNASFIDGDFINHSKED